MLSDSEDPGRDSIPSLGVWMKVNNHRQVHHTALIHTEGPTMRTPIPPQGEPQQRKQDKIQCLLCLWTFTCLALRSPLLRSTYFYSKLYFTMRSRRQSSGKSPVSHSSVEPVCTSPKACPEAVFMYLIPVFKKHVFRWLELRSPVSFSLHGTLQLLKLWSFLTSSITLSLWEIFIC